MEQPPYDWQEARDRIGGDEETLRELAGVFLDEAPEMMRAVREAIDAGDDEELRRAAHTLKGSAAVFVADPAVEAARRIETRAESGDTDGLETDWEDLEREVGRLSEALREAANS